jgi:hypothetical protein
MSAELFSFLIATALAATGIYSIVKKQCSINLYFRQPPFGGKITTVPLFTLHGPRAILYGAVSLVGAAIVLLPLVFKAFHFDPNTIRDDIILIATVIGLIIAGLGFFTASLNEIAHNLRQSAAQKIKKKKRGVDDNIDPNES